MLGLCVHVCFEFVSISLSLPMDFVEFNNISLFALYCFNVMSGILLYMLNSSANEKICK